MVVLNQTAGYGSITSCLVGLG